NLHINQITYALQPPLQKAPAYSKQYQLQNIQLQPFLKAPINQNHTLFKTILQPPNIHLHQLIKTYHNQLTHYP
ncbi:hypothetical protein, partial [Staphylococcus epidermidis]|uniref:hypothetical protein n=1 Tax=Staphylococcus epidermidis TaxID=1282 RepID=UPI001C9312EE